MLTAEEIRGFVEQRIEHIYQRPLLFGKTAENLDLILHYYHEIWAAIQRQDQGYVQARETVRAEEGCGEVSFAAHYRGRHLLAREEEVALYVVKQWRRVDAAIGLPVVPTGR